eukprot:gene1473-biopygen6302
MSWACLSCPADVPRWRGLALPTEACQNPNPLRACLAGLARLAGDGPAFWFCGLPGQPLACHCACAA